MYILATPSHLHDLYSQQVKSLLKNSPADGQGENLNQPQETLVENNEGALDIAKEVAISMVPVYGTIHEFQKGNIGLGLFSLATDLLLLTGLGAGAKVASVAVRGARGAYTVSKTMASAGRAMKKPMAKLLAQGATRRAPKSMPGLASAAQGSAESGIELVYRARNVVGKAKMQDMSVVGMNNKNYSAVFENSAHFRQSAPKVMPRLSTITPPPRPLTPKPNMGLTQAELFNAKVPLPKKATSPLSASGAAPPPRPLTPKPNMGLTQAELLNARVPLPKKATSPLSASGAALPPRPLTPKPNMRLTQAELLNARVPLPKKATSPLSASGAALPPRPLTPKPQVGYPALGSLDKKMPLSKTNTSRLSAGERAHPLAAESTTTEYAKIKFPKKKVALPKAETPVEYVELRFVGEKPSINLYTETTRL